MLMCFLQKVEDNLRQAMDVILKDDKQGKENGGSQRVER